MVRKRWCPTKLGVVVFCLIAVLAIAKGSMAQPIVLQQAENTLAADKVELGIGFTYGYEKWTVQSQTGDNTIYNISIPLLFKWAVTDGLETKLVLPYTTWKITGTTETSNSGIGQMVLGGKLNFVEDKESGLGIGAGIDFELPTGDAAKGLGEGSHILLRGGISPGFPSAGFNTVATGILTQKFEPLVFHVNLGYKYTAKYTVSGVNTDTGDIILYGLAGEYAAGGGLFLIGEVVGTSFGKTKSADIEITDSNGTTLDTVIGLTYVTEGTRLTFGIPIALGNATYRAYDFKIVSGFSLIF